MFRSFQLTRRRTSLGLMIAAACLMATSAARAAQPGLRIAVVRIQDVFEKSLRAQAMKKSIQDDFDQQRQAIEKWENEVKVMEDNLRSDSLLKPGTYAWFEKTQEIKTKNYLIKTTQDKLQAEVNRAMVTYYRTIYQDLQTAIKDYAQRNGVDLVLRATDEEVAADKVFAIQNEISIKMLHYYNPALDCTDSVVELMNEAWRRNPASGAAPGGE